jgi:hypothetical protein
MSHSWVNAPVALVAEARRRDGSGRWLAFCIALGCPGCFYVEPTWRPMVNAPPVLIEPPTADNVLIFDNDSERITVIAADPDGDNLQFVWNVPPFLSTQEVTTPGDAVTFGRLDVFWHPDIDGAELQLTIIDDDARSPRSITATWLVEEP